MGGGGRGGGCSGYEGAACLMLKRICFYSAQRVEIYGGATFKLFLMSLLFTLVKIQYIY